MWQTIHEIDTGKKTECKKENILATERQMKARKYKDKIIIITHNLKTEEQADSKQTVNLALEDRRGTDRRLQKL